MSELSGFLEDTRVRLDADLDAWLPSAQEGGDLARAMRHIVFSGGKRLRPALVFLGCADVGGEQDDARGAAAAVELVHAYSLVHDDLPCMDDATLRRGRPCVHKRFGEAMGVLAGDALLTLAFELLASRTPPARGSLALAALLARASGWAGMVGGQVADLDGEGRQPDAEQVAGIHRRKTAALMSVSLELGARIGGGREEHVQRLAALGEDLGLAFQIVDDLLDLQGSPEQLGKGTGADADRGKMTWPSAVGQERAREDARRLVARARERAGTGPAAGRIESLGQLILKRVH